MLPTMNREPLTVVSGLIVGDNNQVLMALRHPTQSPPSVWEIPGGKVERGEYERDALVREMHEELGVKVLVGQLLSVASFNWDRRINMLLFVCTVDEDKAMQPLESVKLDWVDPREARMHRPCLPSLHTWYPDIESYIVKPRPLLYHVPRISD